MSFLFPAFLIGGLAIAIPIVLHLLRRDVAPEVPFSAVHLLQPSPIERSKRRRLRDVLLLAARIAALLLLAAAFARPYRAGAVAPARMAIIAVDRSFSLSAPGAFDRARALARTAVDDAGSARVAVIAFDERAEVVAMPGSGAAARDAIDRLAVGFGATRYGPAIVRAAELAGGDPGRLTVITDLQRGGWEAEERPVLASTLEVVVKDTGVPPANLAVTQVRLQPPAVVVTLRNDTPAAYRGSVRLALDGREVASAPATVAPGGTDDVTIPYRAPAAGTVVASIDDPSGLAADNQRVLLLGAATRPRVMIVTSGTRDPGGRPAGSSGLYVETALDAASSQAPALEPVFVDGGRLSRERESLLNGAAAVVLLSTRLVDRETREALSGFVRRGGGLIVAAGPDVDPTILSGLLGTPSSPPSIATEERPRILAVTDLRHPIFRPFGSLTANLGQVSFTRAWRLPPAGWDVAASFTDGAPALLERRQGEGRVLCFASDLDRRWNDFPLHPAFVPFVVESVRYAARAAGTSRERTIADAPAGVPPTPGVHRLPDGRQVVLNVDTRESARSRVTAQEFADMLQRVDAAPSRVAHVQAQLTESRQSYWQYGLVLMLVVLTVESVIGRAS
ncbi:MAG: BatA domain-containing protein [Vicinamibacterales bacterium]